MKSLYTLNKPKVQPVKPVDTFPKILGSLDLQKIDIQKLKTSTDLLFNKSVDVAPSTLDLSPILRNYDIPVTYECPNECLDKLLKIKP